jgi:hypothetical protein
MGVMFLIRWKGAAILSRHDVRRRGARLRRRP